MAIFALELIGFWCACQLCVNFHKFQPIVQLGKHSVYSARHPLWSVLFGHCTRGAGKAFICHTSDLFLVEQKPFHHHRNDLWKEHHHLMMQFSCMQKTFLVGFLSGMLGWSIYLSRKLQRWLLSLLSFFLGFSQDFWDKVYERWWTGARKLWKKVHLFKFKS